MNQLVAAGLRDWQRHQLCDRRHRAGSMFLFNGFL